MADFEFVDFDPRSTGSKRRNDPVLNDFADALRANPGRWAKFPYEVKAPSNMAWRINNRTDGVAKPLQGNGFEATARGGICYVRYVKDTADG